MKKIVILGSTGSIGKQTLEVVRLFPKSFKVTGLSCETNLELLSKQIAEFLPKYVSVSEKILSRTKTISSQTKILSGLDGLIRLARKEEADLIVNGLSGNIGTIPTIEAIKAHKNVALANKEALVCSGEKIMSLSKENSVKIIPIDSEHNGIFQCLDGKRTEDVEKIILTCSGGPFLGKTRKELERVTIEEALAHPTWKMGPKISVDSATLVNKGLEVIEASYLFSLPYQKIEVVVHPQSKIHGIVCFKDGSMLMQAAVNDMRIPIAYALHYPKRVKNRFPRLEFGRDKGTGYMNFAASRSGELWTFQKPDVRTFEGLKLAYEALQKGGDFPKRFSEADEKAVSLFLSRKIGFLEIYDYLRRAISHKP